MNSLEIRGFRGFRHLQIERLGRVNLIVGKNNVGKASLLEALHLYVHEAPAELIWHILSARDELGGPSPDVNDMLSAIKYLFYGRREVSTQLEPIQIGPINSADDTFSITIGAATVEVDEIGNRKVGSLLPEELQTGDNWVLCVVFRKGKQWEAIYPLDSAISPRLLGTELKVINSAFISASGLDRGRVGELWDSIVSTDLEKEVLASLRIVAPGVEQLHLVEDTSSFAGEPSTLVKIKGIDDPIPFRSLGGGIRRVRDIVLALVNVKDGMLLIDEIENSIHYSVQLELWQLIFQLAHHLNVQVFVTTHSWDCIEAFQKATQEDTQEEGMLIRLSIKKGEIVATLFDQEELGIATHEQIEVR